MRKLFLTDIDGVVLHWGPGLSHYVKHHLGYKPEGDMEHFYYVEDWLKIPREEAFELIDEFHESEYFKHLPPFLDAPKYLPKFKEHGWEFIAITAVGRSEKIKENRRHNLEVHFPGVFSELITVNPTDPKIEELKQFEPAYWVEDTRKHAYEGLEANHRVFFIDREHDPREKVDVDEHSGITVVQNWEDIYNWFIDNEEI